MSKLILLTYRPEGKRPQIVGEFPTQAAAKKAEIPAGTKAELWKEADASNPESGACLVTYRAHLGAAPHYVGEYGTPSQGFNAPAHIEGAVQQVWVAAGK